MNIYHGVSDTVFCDYSSRQIASTATANEANIVFVHAEQWKKAKSQIFGQNFSQLSNQEGKQQ
jgi:hypothetical protein